MYSGFPVSGANPLTLPSSQPLSESNSVPVQTSDGTTSRKLERKLTADDLKSVWENLDCIASHVGNGDAQTFFVVAFGPHANVLEGGGDEQLARAAEEQEYL